MIELPKLLYRGDSDPARKRGLHATWDRSCLLTNLASGGSGKDLFNAPLIESVNKHVAIGWDKTHFLSFSASPERAKCFAAGDPPRDLVPVPNDSPDWETVVYWSDTSVFQNIRELEPAIYAAIFPGYLPRNVGQVPNVLMDIARAYEIQGREGSAVRVILINVAKYIEGKIATGVEGLHRALTFAEGDQEWLLLPIDPFIGNQGEVTGEFTARVDKGFIHGCQKYRFVNGT